MYNKKRKRGVKMQKANRERTVWLVVGILTAVFAVISIPCIVFSALAGAYFPMAIAIAFVVHGFYGVTFYFLAFARAGDRLRCVKAFEEGLRSFDKISAYTMLSREATCETLALCLKKEYIVGYYLGEEGLVPIVSEVEESVDVVCAYCGANLNSLDCECPCCGARPTN